MGCLHIDNLYKSQDILMFKEVFAMEKCHGTSAHIGWKEGKVSFFSGGEKHANFVALFNEKELTEKFQAQAIEQCTVYGEAYGGKQQGMSHTYGKQLKFIVFDIKIGDSWLSVPQAEEITKALGLEFVPYRKISTDLAEIDKERDADSVIAVRNGITEPKIREGIVLRPLVELIKNNGNRVIAKHKRDEFAERATPQKVVDQAKLKVLQEANAIAEEWVTLERLKHVLDKLPPETNVENTGDVIKAMVGDIIREAKGEIVESHEANKAIGKKTALMFKAYLNQKMRENHD